MSSLADFISFSNFVLGIPLPQVQDLDQGLAQVYMTNLGQGGVDLSNLLATWHTIAQQPQSQWPTLFDAQIKGSATLWPVAQQVVLAWYTGVCGTVPRDPAYYEQTLVWVLAQAHPMGVPLGFGYWQYLPPGANQ